MKPLYVNYAGLAPLRFGSYLNGLFAPELFGNARLPQWFKRVETLREKVGQWLGCQKEQVAFVPSTTTALTIAAHALVWQPGDTVLYPAHDFPANVLPWQSLCRQGVTAIALEDWDAPWPDTTRMVSLSTVDAATGIERPWRKVIQRTKTKNIWTCVDAIQSAGVKPSYDTAIDFWCTGTQKWLVSGLGLAVMVLSPRVLESLSTGLPGWLGLVDPPDLHSGLSKSGQGWEPSWVTPSALARFEASLNYFTKIGWETVTQAVKERRDLLHEALLDMGWNVVSCPERWSGIVSIETGETKARQIVENGYTRRIIAAHRGPYVRISPHMFTTMKQLKKVSQWLKTCRLL